MTASTLLLLLFVFSPAILADEPDTLDAYIRQTLENLREKMPTGIPEMDMPPLDPLVIPVINERIKEGIADVVIKINDLTVTDLSTFNLREVKLDMQTLSLKLSIFLPSVTASAKYFLDGKLASIFPLFGNGTAHFQTTDFALDVFTKLNLNTGKIQMDTMDIKMSFSAISAVFENILGGGNLGDLINSVLNMFGKLIFDSQKANVEKALNGVIRNVVNEQLRKADIGLLRYAPYSPSSNINAQANDFVDKIMTNLRPQLKQYDPLTLPYARDGFSKKVGFIKFKGYAELQTGQLSGLSSLHRVGNVDLSINNVTGDGKISASLGVRNMHVRYNCKLYFMGIKLYPHLTGGISQVNARIVISFNIQKGQKKLDSFKITNIQKPGVKVSNLGPLGFVTTLVLNLAIKPIMSKLTGTLEGAVTNILADTISKADLPI